MHINHKIFTLFTCGTQSFHEHGELFPAAAGDGRVLAGLELPDIHKAAAVVIARCLYVKGTYQVDIDALIAAGVPALQPDALCGRYQVDRECFIVVKHSGYTFSGVLLPPAFACLSVHAPAVPAAAAERSGQLAAFTLLFLCFRLLPLLHLFPGHAKRLLSLR